MKKNLGYLLLMGLTLAGCGEKTEFYEAPQIVARQLGQQRFEGGKKKWEFLEVIGAPGPYTTAVTGDFRGSGGQLGPGQLGTFTVSNGGGAETRKYGGIEGVSHLSIPVQNRKRENAVIVCRTVATQ